MSCAELASDQQQQMWFLLTALTQPALLLIDHGHFQYNTTSLGLALWSFYFMTQTPFICPVFGSVLFSLALNFKQMELYHAPKPSIHHPNHIFDSCTILNGLKYQNPLLGVQHTIQFKHNIRPQYTTSSGNKRL